MMHEKENRMKNALGTKIAQYLQLTYLHPILPPWSEGKALRSEKLSSNPILNTHKLCDLNLVLNSLTPKGAEGSRKSSRRHLKIGTRWFIPKNVFWDRECK